MGKKLKLLLDKAGPHALDLIQRGFLTPDVEVAERRGAALGRLLYRIDKKHRNRTLSNLELAFPEWTAEERLKVSTKVFEHFGRITGDFLRSPIRTNEEVLASSEVVGFEHFEAAFGRGKGVIGVTAHFGNWERFAHWVTAGGREISVIARDANQSAIQERVSRIRSVAGTSVISRGDSAVEISSRLRRNELIGILPDQNSEESFVPFFGHPCGSVLGPAVLHRRTGAALLPTYCARIGPGKYRMIILPPIDLENKNKDFVALTAEMNAALESIVRQYPDQWLWMHDRWKSARMRGML